jgi:hypothetical protein
MTVILSRNCANCAHWDEDSHCALPMGQRLVASYILLPALVVCAKHEPVETDIEGAAV